MPEREFPWRDARIIRSCRRARSFPTLVYLTGNTLTLACRARAPSPGRRGEMQAADGRRRNHPACAGTAGAVASPQLPLPRPRRAGDHRRRVRRAVPRVADAGRGQPRPRRPRLADPARRRGARAAVRRGGAPGPDAQPRQRVRRGGARYVAQACRGDAGARRLRDGLRAEDRRPRHRPHLRVGTAHARRHARRRRAR